ncbi:MAG: aminoacyl-tRNA hydrolase [Clostridia bacterium]|nr:aminoacyl-tRNA hydrolase [Clostridia bacterium]
MADIFELFRQIRSPEAEAEGPVSFIVAGLGNPGKEYDGTRHNVGFYALDVFAAALGVPVNRARFKALVGEGTVGDKKVLLMKPETYMNLSGEALGEAAAFYKIPPERVLVICDDINLAPGLLRIRHKGSAGGHNGLKSIIASLGSDGFPRFRIGVGQKPSPEYDLANWVLGRFGKEDGEAVARAAGNVKEALLLFLDGRCQEAQNKYSK